MTKVDIPKNLLNLQEDLHIDFAEGDKVRKAKMLGYSGKPMNHWLFGKLIVDVKGIKFQTGKIPILEDHDDEKKIGFSAKPDTSEDKVQFDDITLLDTYFADQFYENAKKGFPYQASISFYPAQKKGIEKLEEDDEAEVNGMTVKGPALIFRNSIFRESSVVTFGMDHRTNSKAMSDDKVSIDLSEESADIIQKYLDNPPKEGEINKETKMSKEQDSQVQESNEEIKELREKVQSYETELSKYQTQVQEMQKNQTQLDLAQKVSSEEVEFLMGYYEKLEEADLHAIADKLKSYTDKINALGASKGTDEVPTENQAPTAKDIQQYAKDNNISLLEANTILHKQYHERR